MRACDKTVFSIVAYNRYRLNVHATATKYVKGSKRLDFFKSVR
jgi:hypothetical protein